MFSAQRPVGDNAGRLARLKGALIWPGRLALYPGRDGIQSPSQPIEQYVGVIFQALAVFRFFSFAMGSGLVFFLNLGDEPPIGV